MLSLLLEWGSGLRREPISHSPTHATNPCTRMPRKHGYSPLLRWAGGFSNDAQTRFVRCPPPRKHALWDALRSHLPPHTPVIKDHPPVPRPFECMRE